MTPPPVATEDVEWFRIDHDSAVGAARRAAVALATRLGLGDRRAAELGIAVTEVATNLVKHAGGGSLVVRACRQPDVAGVEIVASDRGPGMRDVRSSFADGTSTAGTLGIGLGAIARLATWWDVHSAPGQGTVIAFSFGLASEVGAPGGARASVVTRPMAGEEVCGDAGAVRIDGAALTGMLVDGLGHGPLAATAANAAARAFAAAPAGGPADLLREVHTALQGTRGAAVAIVSVSGDAARYAGIGNVSGTVIADGRRHGMISYAGIAGSNARTIRENTYEVPPGSVVVMHSDGVTDKMALAEQRQLLGRSPVVVAAAVLRDYAVRNDDASALVISRAAR